MTGPAADIAAAVRTGRRSAVEVVGHHLRLAEERNPRTNAWTAIHEHALEDAAAIDRAVAGGRDPGPLAGVPIGLKDIIDESGAVTTAGSAFYRHHPDRDATVVARLRDAGAVIVGRTGLHEFAYGFSSENPWFGPVRNPWDPTLSPGGSSGGSAAAVADRSVPVSIGTDTGGSVRVPAAICGVYGLKVTHGRVPLTGVFPLAASLDTVGPLAASVDDLATTYLVIAGDAPEDPWSAPHPVRPPGAADLQAIRCAVPAPWIASTPIDRTIRRGFAAFCDRLRAIGAEVVEIDDDALVPGPGIWTISGGEAASVHRRWLAEGRPYGADVAERLERASRISLDDYLGAAAWRSGIRRAAARIFADHDLILTPAVAAMRKPIGVDEIDVDGVHVHYRQAFSAFSALVNHLGTPALVAPARRDEGIDEGPPPSVQLVAPWWREDRLLAVGSALEAAGLVAAPPAPS